MVARHAWLVLSLLATLALVQLACAGLDVEPGPSAGDSAETVPDVFALRFLHPEELSGSVFRGWVQIYNPYDQRPLPGVAVRAEIETDRLDASGNPVEDETRMLEGVTDARGEWPIVIDLQDKGGFLQAYVTAYASYRGVEREVWSSAVSTSESRVILSTDKRLYQPGQTLHVRGLWLDASARARAGKTVELEIRDDRDRQVWRRELVTSSFGVASADWQIPETATAGAYQIQTLGGWTEVRISRYEMARFGVEAEVGRPYYLPAENAEVTVRVTSVDGTPVAGAEVRLDLDDFATSAKEAPPIVVRTDAGGRAEVTVDLRVAHQRMTADYRHYDFRDLDVELTAIDPLSRRSERAQATIRVSRQPIHIYHLGSLPPLPGMPSRAWVATFYPDGEPASCAVELRGCDGETVARLATNSHGVGRLPAGARVLETLSEECPLGQQLELVVADAEGRRARSVVGPWDWERGDEPALAVAGRTLFRLGAPLAVTLVPSEPMERVVVELLAADGRLATRELPRIDGPTPVAFTASDVAPGELRGRLEIRAFPLARSDPDAWDESPLGSRAVIYPESGSLSLEVSAEQGSYRPGASAELALTVSGAERAVLGVAVVDQGIELRQAGEGMPGPALLAGVRSREEREVAGWTVDRLLALGGDASAGDPIDAELDLLAEYLLYERSASRLERDVATPFGNERREHWSLLRRQFAPIDAALRKVTEAQGEPDRAHALPPPHDEASLRELLEQAGVDFQDLRDPWGSPYRVVTTAGGGFRRVRFVSSGLDRSRGTVDDFSAWESKWHYFQQGAAVDRAVARYFRETGGFLAEESELARELARDGIDWSEARDPWGGRYRLRADAAGGLYRLEVRSPGPPPESGRARTSELAWTSELDWGTHREDELREAVALWLEDGNAFPRDDGEVRSALAAAEIEPEIWRDPYHRPLAFEVQQRSEDREMVRYATPDSAPSRERVTERWDEIEIVSLGEDGLSGTNDDHVAGRLSRFYDAWAPSVAVVSRGRGLIAGSVVADDGGVLPGVMVSVRAIGPASGGAVVAVTDAAGEFSLPVAPGTYRVLCQLDGFTQVIYDLVRVLEGRVTKLSAVMPLDVYLEELMVTSAHALVTTGVNRPHLAPSRRLDGGPRRATPRVRHDFPETLLWKPELVVKDGRSELTVELADALTTWKLAALASTADGRIAIAEADLPVTQPFSLDPDLPPVLTAGDEIEVPVYLHNRTPRPRAVELGMKPHPGLVVQRPVDRMTVEGDEARRVDLPLRFVEPGPIALELSATAADLGDAVERAATVRPAGYQHTASHNALLAGGGVLEFDVTSAALPGSAWLEVTIDDGIAGHLTSAIRALARKPTGCAEQQTSTAWLSLLSLRREQAAGRSDGAVARRARANLELVRDSLAQHVAEGGGFAYWPGDKADLALTAYVVDFLNRLETLVDVEPDLGDNARRWLLDQRQQTGPGQAAGWLDPWRSESSVAASRLTAWLTHVLSRGLAVAGDDDADLRDAIDRALDLLERQLAGAVQDAYALAHAILAGRSAGRDVGAWVQALRSLAQTKSNAVYWQLDSYTPFHGWGNAGRLEATAVAVEALLAVDPEDAMAGRGLAFLLLEKDADGMWLSTQATARILHALPLGLPADDPVEPSVEPRVLLDGEAWSPSPERRTILSPGRHRLSFDGELPDRWALMRATVCSVVPWERLSEVVAGSSGLRYDVACEPAASAVDDFRVGRPVRCRVEVERVELRGQGMLIAEVGLPPGVDVDRRSLDRAIESTGGSLQRYEVWPDRVVAYLWPRAGGVHFEFVWRPRLAERASAAPSILYDYYNPESRVVLEPVVYRIKASS